MNVRKTSTKGALTLREEILKEFIRGQEEQNLVNYALLLAFIAVLASMPLPELAS